MTTTTSLGALPHACAAICSRNQDLWVRIQTAHQAWIAAKAATAQALAKEHAALDAFHAARSSFDDTCVALSRVYGTHGILPCPRPPLTRTWLPEHEQIVIEGLARCGTIRVEIASEYVPFTTSILPRLQALMPKLQLFRFLDVALDRVPANGLADITHLSRGIRFLTLAPVLESIDMSTMPFHLVDPATIPGLSTFASFAPVSVDQLGAVAAAWRELKSLDLRDVTAGTALIRNGVLFPRIESLLVKGGADSPLRLLSHRDMPALQSLSLVCDTDAQHGFFTGFLEPGPCTCLRSLSLSGKYAHAFTGSFDQLPELHSLCVAGLDGNSTHDFFQMWKTMARVPRKLAELRLENCAFGLGGATMCDLLTRRQAGRAKLHSLCIVQDMLYKDADDIFPAWMAPRLRQLVEEVTIDTSTSVKLCPRSDD
ncbi:hypothetical protein AURDEDRAFT_128226 [Auricularia subglabra TFB-10046 SS5]|nr:hypothetical protein AURDEDRAFT_128226 [Auricularia subglabra TFB-10046 SS5]